MFWASVILLMVGSDLDLIVNSSQMGTHETEISVPNYDHPAIKNDQVLNLEMSTQKETLEYEKISRTERTRKRKEKHGKISKIRGKTSKNEEFVIKRWNRNNEKDILVRNRTIEILKNGVKILSTNRGHSPGSNKSSTSVNETLLEKILSSGASKSDILISASGTYKLPIGGSMYKNNAVSESSDTKRMSSNRSEVDIPTKKEEDGDYERAINQTTIDYEYDYEDFKDTGDKNQITKSFEKSYPFGSDYESINSDHNVKIILQQIIATLRNFTVFRKDVDDGCGAGHSVTDPCARWLECKNHLEIAFLGENILPSCPCHYPSTIFYNDAIWDQNQKRYFRWRDASNEGERLDIYKPGAVYCIRSLLAQNGASISSQQCCYDAKLRLLTRGSGAGTVNFVSPDVSKTLHDTIDILPWRLCKGDFTSSTHLQVVLDQFCTASVKAGLRMNIAKTIIMYNDVINSKVDIKLGEVALETIQECLYLGYQILKKLTKRSFDQCVLLTVAYGSETWTVRKDLERELYNLARNPDNGNRCPVNPDQEQYEHQVKSSKYF